VVHPHDRSEIEKERLLVGATRVLDRAVAEAGGGEGAVVEREAEPVAGAAGDAIEVKRIVESGLPTAIREPLPAPPQPQTNPFSASTRTMQPGWMVSVAPFSMPIDSVTMCGLQQARQVSSASMFSA